MKKSNIEPDLPEGGLAVGGGRASEFNGIVAIPFSEFCVEIVNWIVVIFRNEYYYRLVVAPIE